MCIVIKFIIWLAENEQIKGTKRLRNILPVQNWYDSGSVLGYCLKGGLRHVKVWPGRVTPTAIVIRECVVWWTEVCGSDCDGSALNAPLGHLFRVTHYLIATTAWLPVVKQNGAQCSCFCTIAICVEIPIPTCSPYSKFKHILSCSITINILFDLLNNTEMIWRKRSCTIPIVPEASLPP